MGFRFESEVVSSWQIQTAIGFRSYLPEAFCEIETVPVAGEIFQVNVLTKTFPESYYLENKFLP